jgi:hypothetical protein
MPEPASQPGPEGAPVPVASASAEEAPVVDGEAGKRGVVVGAAMAALSPEGGQVALGDLQLSVVAAAGAFTQPVVVQAQVLPQAEAAAWSPVGMAFRLRFSPGPAGTLLIPAEGMASTATVQPQQPLSLTIDYSQIPLRYGGSFAERLTLYRIKDCPAEGMAAAARGTAVLPAPAGAHRVPEDTSAAAPCQDWEALPSVNEVAARRLTVSLAGLAGEPAPETPAESVTVSGTLAS